MGRTIPESEQQARMDDIRAILALLTKEGPRNPEEIRKHRDLTKKEWSDRLMRMRADDLIEPETVTLQKTSGRYKATVKGRGLANLGAKRIIPKKEGGEE